MDEPITAVAESYVRALAQAWLVPHDRECLACYLDRSVTLFGCQGDLRLAQRYRDLAAPRATALERKLASCGGYCDCEVLMNSVEPTRSLWTPEREEERPGGGAVVFESEPPDSMPPCPGVRRGSTQPCRNWAARVRLRPLRRRRSRRAPGGAQPEPGGAAPTPGGVAPTS